ncbi:HU family DNA-binding protein [Bacillus pseudomycoides]|nr:HU family DNA-binding protein [Bacillus pseudomycoides]
MNKTALINQVAKKASLSKKDATASVQATLDQISISNFATVFWNISNL